MRSISISKTGDLMPNDSNEFYKNLILNNQAFKDIKGQAGFMDAKKENRAALQQSVRELTGVVAPASPHLKNRSAKGAIKFIAGDQPKHGYFQRKAIYSKMNLTGRGTIAPDETLGLDEVGIPEEMAWEMYTPFILRQFTQKGYSARDAKTEVEERSQKAKDILLDEMDKRPAILNRAPTLWRHSMVAVKPKLRAGKTININTLWESGLGSDFDGDCSLNSIVYRQKISLENQLTTSKNALLLLSSKNTQLENNKDRLMPFTDSKIRYHEGIINLEDFPRIVESEREKGNILFYDVPDGIEILSVLNGDQEWLPVTEYSIHKGLTMLELVTSSNRSLFVSDDDSMITIDEDLNYIKAPPKVGMIIPRVIQPVIQKDPDTELTEIVVDETTFKLDRDFGWLSGAFVGDGWLNKEGYGNWKEHHNDLMVSKTDESFKAKWKGVIHEYFPEAHFYQANSPHDYDGHESFSQKLTCANSTFKNFFRDYHTHSAVKKTLPSFWLKTSEEYRWGLLAGLIDSDGSVTSVQAKVKKYPQLSVSYTSVSKALIFEIVALADSLGLTATAFFSKVTDAGNESWGVTFTTNSIMEMQKKLVLHHSKKRERLGSFAFREETTKRVNAKMYTPQLSKDRLTELRKAIGTKHCNPYSTVCKLIKWGGCMTRATALLICGLDLPIFEESEFWAKWKTMIEDDSIVYDKVTTMRPLPGVTTAYDITAPPNFTMVTEAGYVIQDSVQMHLPITDEAIKELENMYPSKQIFTDKIKGDLLSAPSQEPITGLYTVTKNLRGGVPVGTPKRYRSEKEAWDAYNKGTLKMTDLVEIAS
jgi:DNA-directed RNA polymerase beta' subunit